MREKAMEERRREEKERKQNWSLTFLMSEREVDKDSSVYLASVKGNCKDLSSCVFAMIMLQLSLLHHFYILIATF